MRRAHCLCEGYSKKDLPIMESLSVLKARETFRVRVARTLLPWQYPPTKMITFHHVVFAGKPEKKEWDSKFSYLMLKKKRNVRTYILVDEKKDNSCLNF